MAASAPAHSRSETPGRAYWALAILLALALQVLLPVMGDEAYFIAWGREWRAGIYDHGPLPGWISWLLWRLGEGLGLEIQGVLHRLFSTALGLLGLWLIARRLGGFANAARAGGALLLLALIPGYLVLFTLYLNDTILTFAALCFLLAGEAAFRARDRAWLPVLASGLAFGAVLLTKYNGALLWLGLALALLGWREGRRFLFTRFAAISAIAALPFLWHLWWNWNNCSVNLAFNFAFRNEAAPGGGPLWLGLSLLLMAGPAGFVALARLLRQAGSPGFFGRAFLATLLVMLAVSLWRREFGANWGAPLGFMAVLALAETGGGAAARAGLRRAGAGLAALVLLPLALLLLASRFELIRPADLPGISAEKAHAYQMRRDLADGTLPRLIAPLMAGRELAVMEYGIGAALENAGLGRALVFSRSVFGRNQDLLVDFRALDGRDMVLLLNGPAPEPELAARLFARAETRELVTARGRYQVILGRGFDYEAYRRDWILPVISELYDRSPFPYGRCAMDRYR